jgi:hypothetical protein
MALVATATVWSRIPAFLPVFVVIGAAVGLSGCNQSSKQSSAAQPSLAAAPPATGEPVALSGSTYTQAPANPQPVGSSQADIVKPPSPTNQTVASTPLWGSDAPRTMPAANPTPPPPSAPPPVVASAPPKTEPLPGLMAAPPPQTEPLPGLTAPATMKTPVISAPSPAGVTPSMPTIGATGEVSGPAVDAKGFPNINVQPPQPTAQLLTPEERAKLIAELNALAGRPTQ